MSESVNLPRREIAEAGALRALAHPLRWRLLRELVVHGPATATALAERVDESPSNCSWHLRQLAKHGFVEEAEGGTGRQRPWRFVLQATSVAEAGDDPETAHAREALLDFLRQRDLQELRAWEATQHREPSAWREAAVVADAYYVWLSAEELAAFTTALTELIHQHLTPRVGRVDPAHRPPGSRPITFTAWAVPAGPPHEEAGRPATDPPGEEDDDAGD